MRREKMGNINKIKAKKKYSTGKLIFRIFITVLIILLAVLMCIPFLWMISASFKKQADVMTTPIQWIPNYLYIGNYLKVLSIGTGSSTDYHFLLAYWNTIVVSVSSTVVAVFSAGLAGYAFAKLKFKGSNVLFLVYLAQMMVPSQLTLIPRFVIFSGLGLTNTYWSLILPKVIAVSATFMMRQSFLGVPEELREAAKIDGAGEYRIWARIMAPMVKPTFAAIGTVQFLEAWNSYLDPLVFISNWRKWTLTLALDQFVSSEATQYNLIMAACCLAVIPVFIVFLCGQKFFLKGLTVGAVKG